MKQIFSILILLLLTGVTFSQNLTHEFTMDRDSVKLSGLKLSIEIDSTYQVSDSSGIKFNLLLTNNGDKILHVTNPLYDPMLSIIWTMYLLPSKTEVHLKQVSRLINAHASSAFRPYKIETIKRSGIPISNKMLNEYINKEMLQLEPKQQIAISLNLFEQILIDETDEPRISPLVKGEYYLNLDLLFKIDEKLIHTKPFRFKLKLE